MKPLNLITEPRAPLQDCTKTPLKKIRIGGKTILLDPGTLSCSVSGQNKDVLKTAGREPIFIPSKFTRPRGVVLSLTRRCNLSCNYCYVMREHSASEEMSLATAIKAVGLLDERGDKSIGFFGGEPTLAWDVITGVVSHTKKRTPSLKRGISYSLTTNATLLTEERAKFLAENNFSLIVSLDGPKSLHDSERISSSGAGSFDSVLDGLKLLSDAGLSRRITLRATYPLNNPKLVKRLAFLNELCEQNLAGNVSVEPAWPDKKLPLEINYSRLKREYLCAARWAKERLRENRPVKFHHFKTFLTRLLLRKPAGSECGAGFGYIQVSPDGTINTCHKEQGGAIGNVENGINELSQTKWRENRYLARTGCLECWARNICGGGCRALSSEYCGDISIPWEVECKIRHIQIKAAIYLASCLDSSTLAANFAPRKKIRFIRKKQHANTARP